MTRARVGLRTGGSSTRSVTRAAPGTACSSTDAPAAATSHSRAPTGSGNHTSSGPSFRLVCHAAVVPLERPLVRARGAGLRRRQARPRRPRDVDLVGAVERVGRVPGQHVAEPGHEPAPGHEDRVRCGGRRRRARGARPGRRRCRPRPPRATPFRTARRAHSSAGTAGTAMATASVPGGTPPSPTAGHGTASTERPSACRDVVRPRPVATGHEQPVEARRVEQLAGGADGHLAGAHQEHRGHRSSGPSSSRQPPVVEGTLPLARSRTTMPAVIAIAATSSPRRNAFTVGLGGIEPPTSSLSGMRSNRLSYSPGGDDDGSRSRGLSSPGVLPLP